LQLISGYPAFADPWRRNKKYPISSSAPEQEGKKNNILIVLSEEGEENDGRRESLNHTAPPSPSSSKKEENALAIAPDNIKFTCTFDNTKCFDSIFCGSCLITEGKTYGKNRLRNSGAQKCAAITLRDAAAAAVPVLQPGLSGKQPKNMASLRVCPFRRFSPRRSAGSAIRGASR
jgi:hypothetical protein